ncbi:hypothetical protein [Sporosarcina sp. SAFN-010]|uniref:hypothetical protein n=1 Tax=Sporosarcina sp. SAFN-010 TaxID=3387273 RepID=UPI003F7E96E3
MVALENEQSSKLDKWRGQYGALVIAFTCLIVLITGWGNNWILTGVLGLGVLVCGTIGFFDLRRGIYNENK